MRLERIQLKGFTAYEDVDLDLSDVRTLVVLGPNGAGKSSLFIDGPLYALTGEARLPADELVREGETEMSATVEFELAGERYRVTRARSKQGRGKTLLAFQQWDGAEWQDRTGETIAATQERITALLRVNRDTLVASAFLVQGKADAFTSAGPAQRKTILAEILGLDRYVAIEQAAKDRAKEVAAEITALERTIESLEEEVAARSGYEQALAAQQAAAKDAEHKVALAEECIQQAETELADLAGRIARLEARAALIPGLQAEVRDAGVRVHDLATEEQDLQAEQERAEDVRRRADQLRQFRDEDAALTELSERVQALRDKLAEAGREREAEVAAARAKVDALWEQQREAALDRERERDTLRAQRDQWAHIRDQKRQEVAYFRDVRLRRVQDERRKAEAARAEALRAARAERDELIAEKNAKLRELEAATKSRERRNANVRLKRTSLEGRIERAKDQAATLSTVDTDRICQLPRECPFLAGAYKAEGEIEALQAELAALVTEDEPTEEELRLDAEAHRLNGEIEQASERVAELEAPLEWVEPADEPSDEERALAAEIEALDERIAAFVIPTGPSEKELEIEGLLQQIEIPDGPSEKERSIQADIAALGYDAERHRLVRTRIAQLAGVEDELRRLERIDEALRQTRMMLAEARETLTRKEAELAALRAEVAGLDDLRTKRQVCDLELTAAKVRLRDEQGHLQAARAEIARLERDLQRIAATESDLEADRKERANKRQLHADLQLLAGACGKNGAPALIIENALPELEARASDLLQRMTDGRFRVEFETQVAAKTTDNVRETLEIHIHGPLGSRPYLGLSGGEQFRANLAIRLGLAQLLAGRAGASIDTLIIDEGLGSLDEAGKQAVIEAIQEARSHFAKVLLITHIDSLAEAFDTKIYVEPGANGSRVRIEGRELVGVSA